MREWVGIAAAAWWAVGAGAQMHKVAKPEDVVRAIGVYEYTGDMTKPTASRLIPVSVFINGKLEDAAVYLARPVPFALQTGNLYELDEAGVGHGMLDLAFARHMVASEASNTNYDDGWFGYGKYVAPAPPKKTVALRQTKTPSAIVAGKDPDRPSFSSKSAKPGTGATAPAADTSASTRADTPADDPDRPTMKRHTDSTDQTASGDAKASSGDAKAADTAPVDPDRPTMTRHPETNDPDTSTTASAGAKTPASGDSTTASAPADDPDRPTMKRHTDSSDQTASADTKTVPADDPDRPTLRRRSPEEAKKAAKEAGLSGVSGVSDLNDDPNRPTLHHGKPAGGAPAEADFTKLAGLPVDLHQMVAVSDAANRPAHNFAREWENEAQKQEILGKMEAVARAQLAAYPAAAPAPAVAAPAKTVAHTTASKSKHAVTPPPPPEPLADVDLKGYTLSYGGAPTYVYTAHTTGTGAAVKYVTVVAQVNMQGAMEVAMKSVTDAGHLDRTPRMRLVDAVDVEASNRASLLFELRGENARQFALYRVIGARADQVFATGTTQ